jgi:hypothetical protein
MLVFSIKSKNIQLINGCDFEQAKVQNGKMEKNSCFFVFVL